MYGNKENNKENNKEDNKEKNEKDNIIEVVGTLFLKEGKLLLCKPRYKPTYQLVGGKVEDSETIFEAVIRECHEELGDKAKFDENKIEYIMDFIETAASDHNQKIHMHIFKYNGVLEGEIITSEEIEDFIWYNLEKKDKPLSFVLKNKVILFALNEGWIY